MPDIGFYIHHQGSGHFYRALSIASSLSAYRITFFGSDLARHSAHMPPHIHTIHLAPDYEPGDSHPHRSAPDVFHYAPLYIAGLRTRNAALVNWFVSAWPCLLIVDVSVEVTLLARLCGVHTIVMKLNGNRNDLPHLSAFQSAEKIIAPYPQWMEDDETPQWVRDKTFYSGGFCRFDPPPGNSKPVNANQVTIMLGSGGTKLDQPAIRRLAQMCPGKQFTVLGLEGDAGHMPPNLRFMGFVDQPFDLLAKAAVVIGSAGDNVVMEVAQLRKKFICIPENRPFAEQENKAVKLARQGVALMVPDPDVANWPELFEAAHELDPARWDKVINPKATLELAGVINEVYSSLFQ